MNYYSIVPSDKTHLIIKHLVEIFGLPIIKNDLSLYLENNVNTDQKNRSLLHLQFLNNESSFRFINKDSNYKINSSGQIYLRNKNIKYFLKFLQSIHYDQGVASEIVRLDFYDPSNNLVAQCNIDSIHGDLFVFYSVNKEILDSIKRKYNLHLLSSKEYSSLPAPASVIKEGLFNELGLVNPKINSFTKRFGSDLLLETPCLEVKMNAMSNDYSFYEPLYKLLTNNDLISLSNSADAKLFKPLSIIIPAFNSNDTVIKTLFSIEGQNLLQEDKVALDVIVVDDGSIENLHNVISKNSSKLSFRPRIIRMEQNVGPSATRNVGLELAKYEYVLFIDSDILLASNYLLEMSIRLQAIPNAVFISLKQNIESNDPLVEEICLMKGLPSPDTRKDKRISRQLIKDQINHHHIYYDINVEIINDTNYFKDLGFGRTVGGYDLPAMVVSHNMCLKKSLAKKVGGFGNYFQGWGLEDTYFGARIIAAGNFVIPVLSTGVYHITHPPRSGSEKQREREFQNNIDRYLELIRTPLV